MKGIFIETPRFTQLLANYLSDEAYRELQQALLECPEFGDVIPGAGGFRKLRWRDSRRGKGARGGLRVIYHYLLADREFWMFTLYDKDEMTDLTAQDKRALKSLIQAELAQRKKQ